MPTYTNKGSYLLVESDEPYSLDLFMTIIHETAEQCKQGNLNKALVDISKMTGNLSTIDRYETGLEISQYLGAKIQVASVVADRLITFMAETVARILKSFQGWLRRLNGLKWRSQIAVNHLPLLIQRPSRINPCSISSTS